MIFHPARITATKGVEVNVYRVSTFLSVFLVSAPSFAHHSVNATFDSSKTVEVEGEITNIGWRNPHVSFSLRRTSEAGPEEIWVIELTSLSTLRRRKLTADFMGVGDRIKVAGSPAKNGGPQIYGRNILLPSGDEVILESSGTARWPDVSSTSLGISQDARVGDPSAPELGIFRVWSSPLRGRPIWKSSYPLTAAAQARVAAFDPAVDSPTKGCAPKGMPTMMEQPYPMEFLQQGDDIVVRLEEYDAVRIIHMSPSAADSEHATSGQGYSVGHWQGSTLVVATSDINWPYFDREGVTLSPVAEMLERFTLAEDGSRLDYAITTTDPEIFTEPVTLEKHWLWFPDVEVQPFECSAD